MVPTVVATQLSALNAFHLARTADCASPDAPDSPGARLLLSVRDDVLTALDEIDADDWPRLADALADRVPQIAEDAPDVMTPTRWREFTDLAAYQEDLTESGEIDPADLTESVAGRALCQIAQRLAALLFATAQDAYETFTDDATNRATDLGGTHGRTAAAHWTDHTIGAQAPATVDRDARARRVLTGLAEGDDEITDQIPAPDLTGAGRDGLTIASLLTAVDAGGLDPTSALAQDLADTYRLAFVLAAETATTAACRALLALDA